MRAMSEAIEGARDFRGMMDKIEAGAAQQANAMRLHEAEKPELCQKHLHRCPEPRTVDCCGVVDEHDIVECHRCGKQWTVPCNFDDDYS